MWHKHVNVVWMLHPPAPLHKGDELYCVNIWKIV